MNADDDSAGGLSFSVICGTAIAGAAVGMILSGPTIAVGLATIGAGAAITQGAGTFWGEFTRGVGRLTANSYEAAKRVEEKNHIFDNVHKWAADNKLFERGKEAAENLYTAARDIDEKHKLTKKASDAILEGINRVNLVFEKDDKK